MTPASGNGTVIALALLLSNLAWGCQSFTQTFTPATAASLTPTELHEIRNVIGAATGQNDVPISPDAFQSTHILVLDRALGASPRGRIATGRTASPPATFHLLSDGKRCVLLHVDTSRRYPLDMPCQP